MIVLRTVGRQPAYIVLGCACFAGLAVLYLWSSQVLIVNARGVSFFFEPSFMAAALIMSAQFGLLIPLQVYAFRRATALVAQSGSTALGALLGATSMTCCAPVLLPSLLSLLGFSGVTILSLNVTLNRFWLPLATLSVILLAYSLVSTVRSLEMTCRVDMVQSSVDG